MRGILIWLLSASLAWAEGETAGEFDYFVLSLSWSPNWCALEGDARDANQCEARPSDGEGHGWTLHGLWPQYHRGWPSFCPTPEAPPSRAMTAGMADIMGSAGLAWHQWKKHGTCSGLSAVAYFARSREAYGRIVRPAIFRKLDRAVKLPAAVVEAAFLEANPGLEPDGITITCRTGHIQEAKICLSRTLEPVPCGGDVATDCALRDAVLVPIR